MNINNKKKLLSMLLALSLLTSCTYSGIISSGTSEECITSATKTKKVPVYDIDDTAKTERLEISVLDTRRLDNKISDNIASADVFVMEITLSVKNIGSDKLECVTGMFRLKSDDGVARDEIVINDSELAAKRLLNAVIDAGNSKTGTLFFELPDTAELYLLVNSKADDATEISFRLK